MRSALIVYIALTVLTLGVFALWPGLDLAVALSFSRMAASTAQGSPIKSPATFSG